jgi:REP element-mobilizing transposase RayT
MLETPHNITAQRCKDWGGELMEFNGEADHVHALVSLPPNLDLSRCTGLRLTGREPTWARASEPETVHQSRTAA